MSDELKLRETLSALMDGEANELEVQRLLNQPISANSLATLRRYRSVCAVLAGHRSVATLDVSARVAAALQDEQPLHAADRHAAGQETEPRKARWQLLGGVAVAASVAFGVIFSAQLVRTTPEDAPAQVAQAPALPAAPLYQGQPSIQNWPADQNQSADMAATVAASVEERTVSEEHLRRLNEYLMRHAEHAALNGGQSVVPFARLAGYETSQPSQR